MDLELFLRSLEAEFDARRRQEADDLVEELAEAERSSVRLAERLLRARGASVALILRGGLRLNGRIVDAARNWLVLREGTGASLVPLGAIVAAWPLGAGGESGGVRAGLGITSALRGLASRGEPVVIDHDAGSHTGVIRDVFADHFDIEASPSIRDVDSRERRAGLRIALVTSGIRRIRSVDPTRGAGL